MILTDSVTGNVCLVGRTDMTATELFMIMKAISTELNEDDTKQVQECMKDILQEVNGAREDLASFLEFLGPVID